MRLVEIRYEGTGWKVQVNQQVCTADLPVLFIPDNQTINQMTLRPEYLP